MAREGHRSRQVGRPPVANPLEVRATVSLRRDVYETIEALARQKKVSAAWILREAADRYLADQWPLLGKDG